MKKFGWLVMFAALLAAPVMANGGGPEIGYTKQCWDFTEASGRYGILPEINENPYNDPFANIVDMTIDRQGVEWNQGGYWQGPEFKIFLDIPNQQIDNPYKLLTIELTYKGNISFLWAADVVTGFHFDKIGQPIEDIDPTSGWKTFTQEFRIAPNPREEIVVIGLKGDIGSWAQIDKICVETWCIPEPATMALFGLGAAALLRRRKRA